MLRLGLKDRWAGVELRRRVQIRRPWICLHRRNAGGSDPQPGPTLGGTKSRPLSSIRGAVGESWEKLLDTNDLRMTRSATTSLNLNRSQWGAKLTSSYEWLKQGTGAGTRNIKHRFHAYTHRFLSSPRLLISEPQLHHQRRAEPKHRRSDRNSQDRASLCLHSFSRFNQTDRRYLVCPRPQH